MEKRKKFSNVEDVGRNCPTGEQEGRASASKTTDENPPIPAGATGSSSNP